MPAGGISDKLGSGAIVASFPPRKRVLCVLNRAGSLFRKHNITPYLATNRQKRAVYRTPDSKTVGWTGESGLPLAANPWDLYLFSSPSIYLAALTKGATPSRLTTLPTSRAS